MMRDGIIKMKEFKLKVKEKWRRDCSIKVKTLMDITENPKGCFKNEEKLVNISIETPYGHGSSCSFKTTKKGKKEALAFLKERLYL